MTSGALITAIAILAAVWIQADYPLKLRLKLARLRPLRTSICATLATTCGLGGIELLTGMEIVPQYVETAGAGAGVLVVVGAISWVMLAIGRSHRFGKWNADKYDEAVFDAVAKGDEGEMRQLARELKGSWEGIVANARHRGRSKQGGKEEKAAWSAVRIMNATADGRMMEAISKEGGMIVRETIREMTAQDKESTVWKRLPENAPSRKMEELMIAALTRQAVKRGDRLLEGTETLIGPRRDEHHPTQMRWSNTILDEIWGSKDVLERHRPLDWFWGMGYGQEIDSEKLSKIVLAIIDTILGMWWSAERGFVLKELIEERLRRGATEENAHFGERNEYFIRDMLRMIDRRVALEKKKEKNEYCTALVQPREFIEAIARALITHALWASRRTTRDDAWQVWLGCRCHLVGPEGKDDDTWGARVQRAFDNLLWGELRWIGRGSCSPRTAALLGFYLRMEGIFPKMIWFTDHYGPKTAKKHRTLWKAVRRACRRNLSQIATRNPGVIEDLCRDGLEIDEKRTKLTYEKRGIGGWATYTLALEKYEDGGHAGT